MSLAADPTDSRAGRRRQHLRLAEPGDGRGARELPDRRPGGGRRRRGPGPRGRRRGGRSSASTAGASTSPPGGGCSPAGPRSSPNS